MTDDPGDDIRCHVWVLSETSGRWEQYTQTAFRTHALAAEWASRYITRTRWEVRDALARLSTPKEPTINEKATRARNLVLEGREDEAKDVWSE